MLGKRGNFVQSLLGLCPLLVALLWLAGVARFRHYEMAPMEWAVVVAAGLALHLLKGRLLRPRPLPPLPAHATAGKLAALAALVIGGLAFVIGGVIEALAEPMRPTATPWLLRTSWHAACSFAASYCAFLQRLHSALAPPPRPRR